MEINAIVWMEHMIMAFSYARFAIFLVKHAKITYSV